MACGTTGYKQSHYGEVANEMKSLLVEVEWKKDKSHEMHPCSSQPQQTLVCDPFMYCVCLSRVASMNGNGVEMLGKVPFSVSYRVLSLS